MTQDSGKIPMKFHIYRSGQFVGTEELAQDIVKIGKLPSSHLRLEDDNVSRMHAVIEVSSPDDVHIIDLGSASGTFVNGQKVNKSQVQNHDQIVLGDTQIVLELAGMTAPTKGEPTAQWGQAAAQQQMMGQQQAAPQQPQQMAGQPQQPPQPQQQMPQSQPSQQPMGQQQPSQPAPGQPAAAHAATSSQPPGFSQPPSPSQPAAPPPPAGPGGGGGAAPPPAGGGGMPPAGGGGMPPAGGGMPPGGGAPPGGGRDGSLPNPFAAPAPAQGQPGAQAQQAEDPEQLQYGIVASGPPVPSEEVETSDQAVEVVVMWGDQSVLHVEHLSPPRPFYVGEPGEGKKGEKVDYLIGSEVLGTQRMPVVTQAGAGAAVIIPQGATGEVTVNNQTITFEQLQQQGQMQQSSELPGAMQYPLPAGASCRMHFRGFTFVVRPTQAGKRIGNVASIDWQPIFYIGGSLLVFSVFLILFYFTPPQPSALSLELLNKDSRLVKYLSEPPETQEEETPEWLKSNKDQNEGGKGKRHKGEEGKMGKKEAKKTNNKYAIKGPKDNPDPHMAKEKAKKMAKNAGIIGTLKSMSGAWNSPTSPYGQDQALGRDSMSALGGLMGDKAGENFGFGGLGMRGTGRGGGGTGEGTIGLGNMGTIGHGGGGGSGSGYGKGAGGFHGRKADVPKIRSGAADVRGSLSKEVIRRVIRRHINEVRFCYEQQLNQRPDLEGRVTVKFIISPTGAVQSAMVSGSTIGSAPVESCTAKAVRRWTFPAPEGGGIVVVNYPFMLTKSG